MAADPLRTAAANDDAVADDPPLAPIVFDTATLPPAEQLPAFATYSPNSRFTRTTDGPFTVRARIWPLDEMILAETWTDPIVSTRDARLIKAQPADHYMVIVPLTTGMTSVIDGIEADCVPGTVLINDFTRPSVTISTGVEVLVLTIARAFVEEAAGSAQAHGLLPQTGETRIFIDFLQSLVVRLPQTRMASVPVLSRIVRDLLAMAIRASGDGTALPQRSAGVRARVRSHIAALPPGNLDIDVLMKDLGLSRSSLFRAFRQDGGVLAYDRKRRLRMLHRLLIDVADPRGIAELGFACGFLDMPALSRLFRSTYGYTMGDLRRHADHPVTPLSDTAAATSGERYRALVAGLS